MSPMKFLVLVSLAATLGACESAPDYCGASNGDVFLTCDENEGGYLCTCGTNGETFASFTSPDICIEGISTDRKSVV